MDFEVTVIGGGPGGYATAIKSAQRGKKTCVIEKENFGGVCLNEGCIPTKTLIKTINVLEEIKRSSEFAIEGLDTKNVKVSMEKLQKRKEMVRKQLVGGTESLLESNGVEIFNGEASFKDKNTVIVNGKEITSENIIIATGSKTAEARFIERIGETNIITSKEALELEKIPKSISIIGGGVIGIEFAYIFSKLGTKVTVLELMDRILPMVDEEISNILKRNLEKSGVKIINNARVKSVNENTVHYEFKGKEEFVISEYTLLSIGRTPNTENLNLEAVGIELDGKAIKVDEYLRTNIQNIYAIGDVNGKSMLAHTASHEGMVALDSIFGKFREMEYDKIPSCIYVNPEIASIGLTEEQAKEKYGKIKVGKFPIIGNGKAVVEGNTEGLIKVILDVELDEILGVHIMSIHATDMIAEIAAAMNLESTSEEIMNSIHPHPTVSEIIPEAFMAANGRAIHF